VGTKVDLRGDPETLQLLFERGFAPISTVQGNALAAEIDAVGYFETSAITQSGLKPLFNHAIRKALVGKAAQRRPSHKRSSWGLSRLFKRVLVA